MSGGAVVGVVVGWSAPWSATRVDDGSKVETTIVTGDP